jgi:ABC-type dipeptide/oligopeptide/nickel transport system permease component
MVTYVVRRILLAVPTLLGVVTVVFMVVRLLPGDPARAVAGLLASPVEVARIRHQFGLDQPIPVQYIQFVAGLARGDFGTSNITGQPVMAEIGARLPYTIELTVIATLIAVVIGMAMGVLSAARHGSVLDLAISALSVFGVSMPVYWLGLMLIILFAVQFRLLPAGGTDAPLSFVLPSFTLSVFSIGLIARMTRSSTLEVLKEDYIRTARAKGVGRVGVLVYHALRNSLLPVITAIGLQFGALLGGAVLTETVFSWPGVGRLLVASILNRDYPVVEGAVLIFSVSYIAVNLLVDLSYGLADPRIRYE